MRKKDTNTSQTTRTRFNSTSSLDNSMMQLDITADTIVYRGDDENELGLEDPIEDGGEEGGQEGGEDFGNAKTPRVTTQVQDEIKISKKIWENVNNKNKRLEKENFRLTRENAELRENYMKMKKMFDNFKF